MFLWCCNCFKRSDTDKCAKNRHKGSTVTVKSKTQHKNFFVITAIFNPASYQRRYELYHDFAQHMKDSGAQLITIECIFPSLNQHEFRVTEPKNQFHIQLKSDSVYWMKENLINIAVSRLPPHAKWVAWLDADIQFHAHNWIDLTLEALKIYSVVQLFERAEFLGPGPKKRVLKIDHSFGYSVVHGKPIDQSRYSEWYPHPGTPWYAWAMSLGTYRMINGLPEYCIAGSADLHFAYALIDKIPSAIEKNLNPQFKEFVLKQSKNIYKKLRQNSNPTAIVGYVPGLVISHHWHGSRKNRQYVDRWKILIAHSFNYATDVKKNLDGVLVLVDKKVKTRATLRNKLGTSATTTTLQKDIISYFRKRNEDEDEDEDEIEDNLLEWNTKKKKEGKSVLKRQDEFDHDDGGDTSSSHIVEIAIAMLGITNTFCDESHSRVHVNAHARTHDHRTSDIPHEPKNDHSKINNRDVSHNYENQYEYIQMETTTHY